MDFVGSKGYDNALEGVGGNWLCILICELREIGSFFDLVAFLYELPQVRVGIERYDERFVTSENLCGKILKCKMFFNENAVLLIFFFQFSVSKINYRTNLL